MPQDYNLKEGHYATSKADSQTSPMGRERNDKSSKLELDNHESSTIDMLSTEPIQTELTSPWPDQWRLEELGNDMTDPEDPWSNLEGTNAWNNSSETEELDLTDNAPYATPWGLLGEPC